VILNILQNAFQAMNGEGQIFVETETVKKEEMLFNILRIRNTNSYLPPDLLAKIFDPFFTSGKTYGTGLGLAIAKSIVESHGGSIFCRSAVDFGVEFELRFPVS